MVVKYEDIYGCTDIVVELFKLKMLMGFSNAFQTIPLVTEEIEKQCFHPQDSRCFMIPHFRVVPKPYYHSEVNKHDGIYNIIDLHSITVQVRILYQC